MAQIINIAGSTPVDDPEYRYKMPRIIAKVEGRGNGIKTVIPNMTLLASSLHRTPGEVTKFFGCEMGAQTTWTEEVDRAVVNGAHTAQALQDKLSVYIEKFVLCPSCKLPETSYKIKHEVINHQCVACGARTAVDMTHKLTTFILKVHKTEKKDKDKKDKKKDKKDGDETPKDEKKEKKKKKDKKKDGDEDDEDKERRRKERKERKKREKAEAAEGGKAKDGSSNDDESSKGGGDEYDEEEEEKSAIETAIIRLREYLATHTEDEFVSELRAVQTFCALPRTERGYICVAAALPEGPLDPPEAMEEKQAVFKAFAAESGAQSLISGLEKLCALDMPDLAPKFALVLKQLYDHEILTEEEILEWHSAGVAGTDREVHTSPDLDDVTRAALLANTEPFITWLKEAEDEDDTDEDE